MIINRFLLSARPWGILASMLTALLIPLTAVAETASLITAITQTQEHPGISIVVNRAPKSVRSFLLREPDRLVVDISPARLAVDKQSIASVHPQMHRVRAAQFSPQTARIVLDLTTNATHQISTRPQSLTDNSHVILVTLAPQTRTDEAPAQPLDQKSTALPAGLSPDPTAGPALSRPQTGKPQSTRAATRLVFSPDGDAAEHTAPAAHPWGNLAFSGQLMARGAHEIHHRSSSEQAGMIRNTVRLEGKWTPPASAAVSPAAARPDTTFLLASVQSDYLWFGPTPSADDYDLELYEAYLLHATPHWDFRLGRQQVRWGKTDEISPVDNLNPQDMREFMLLELEERKIPNWMARLRFFPGQLTIEGVLIPFSEPNKFDYSGTTWALFGPEQPAMRIDETTPDNVDGGLRLSTTTAGWDLGVSYLHATEKSPRLRFEPVALSGPTLHTDYQRQNIFGFEFETTLNKFGLRGEGAYFDQQSLPTSDLNSATTPVLHYVLGVDYIGEQDWYANVQFSHLHVVDHDSDILYLEEDNFSLNGEINKEFWRGNLMLKLGYAVNIKDGGSLFAPEAILTSMTNLELTLGANLFFGSAHSYLGQHNDHDLVFIKAAYRF